MAQDPGGVHEHHARGSESHLILGALKHAKHEFPFERCDPVP